MAKLLSVNSVPSTTALTTVYTVPAGTVTQLTEIDMANNSQTNIIQGAVYIYKGAVRSTIIAPLPQMMQSEVKYLGLKTVLNVGDTIQIQTDTANAMEVIISFTELVQV